MTSSDQPLFRASLLAFFAIIAVDFFVHGGLLAHEYLSDSHAILLAPWEAMRRIPLGYASYGVAAFLLAWLSREIGVSGAAAGTRFGLAIGASFGAIQFLGLVSITRLSPLLLLEWSLAAIVEAGIAGAVIGAALGGVRLRRIAAVVAVLFVVLVSATIAIQSVTQIIPKAG